MSRIRVIMPKMGMTMTEGSVASWEKHDGDHVNEGEVIAMVETDKITNSLESPATGILHTTVEPARRSRSPAGSVISKLRTDPKSSK